MNKRNYAFDFLKVFLVYVVVVHHSNALTHYLHRGYMAVDCFFMISGYLIARTQAAHPEMTTWTYLKRRIGSLYPAYIFAYILLAAAYIPTGRFIYQRSYGALLEIFLLQDVCIVSNSINYGMWYLSVLMTAGTLIYLLLRRLPRRASLILAPAAAILLYVWHKKMGGIEQWSMQGILYPPFWRGTAGILTGVFLYRFEETHLHNLFAPIAKLLEIVSFSAMVILICTPGIGIDYYVLIAIIVLIFSLTFPDPLLARLGKSKAVSFLIRHEYAVYLHHVLLIFLCEQLVQAAQLPKMAVIPLVLIGLTLFAVLSDAILNRITLGTKKLMKK